MQRIPEPATASDIACTMILAATIVGFLFAPKILSLLGIFPQ